MDIVNDSKKVHKSNKINIGRSSSLDKLMRITNTMTSSKQSSVDNNILSFQSSVLPNWKFPNFTVFGC